MKSTVGTHHHPRDHPRDDEEWQRERNHRYADRVEQPVDGMLMALGVLSDPLSAGARHRRRLYAPRASGFKGGTGVAGSANGGCQGSLYTDEVDVAHPKGRPRRLTPEERKSLTHGDFWIPDDERVVYKRALEALTAAEVPFVVAGAYAIYEHTGIYRKTKDLDLFFEPAAVVPAARALRAAGFVTRLEDAHWLAKATSGETFVDLIFGMGNGVALIDGDWLRYSRQGVLAATPVRIAPPEELLWHRLFISERHRHDIADILHLILCLGDTLDWNRLVARVGEHWPLLLAQLLSFSYVYPGYRATCRPGSTSSCSSARVPRRHRGDSEDADFTRGPLISRFSFAIDVREWGFVDPSAATGARGT